MSVLTLTTGQASVLRAFAEYEKPLTDVALTTFAHHMLDDGQSSSSIRSRRAEIARLGLVQTVGTHRMASGRNAAVFALTARGKRVAKSHGFYASQAVTA